jgi:thiol-disulfide isomerase/thioredoxin
MKRRGLARALAFAVGLLVAVARPGPLPAQGGAHADPRPAAAEAGGDKAPYRVVDLEAVKTLLGQARGHVLLVHFWASWCLPCLKELPLMDRFAKEMRSHGLEVLSLSLDNPASMAPRVGALLRRSAPNLTPNIARFDDADALIAAVDPHWEGAIPAVFAFDHHGRLRGNLIGEASRAELDGLVAGLLKAAANPGPPLGNTKK